MCASGGGGGDKERLSLIRFVHLRQVVKQNTFHLKNKYDAWDFEDSKK